MKAKLPVMYSYEHMSERIQYLDMLALMVLHEEFGFGAERLTRYYRAILTMDEHYKRYNANHEPQFGKKTKDGHTRSDLYELKKDLYAIGIDYDKLSSIDDL